MTNAADTAASPWSVRQTLSYIASEPFLIFTALSLLLVGADLLAIKLAGLSMRLVFPVLMLAFAFMYMRTDRILLLPGLAFLFMSLAIAGALSTLGSYDAVKSVGYTVWVLFDFFIIITLAFNFARKAQPEGVLSLWFLIYRVHVLLLLCELGYNLLYGDMGRPHVWFYESSYLAIFMTGYFGAALYMFLRHGRVWSLDLALSFVGLLATTSATGIFGMVFAVLLNFVLARQRLLLMAVASTIATAFAGALFLFFKDTVYYNLVLGFLVQDEFSIDLILSRGGNRVIRALVGWDAFLHHPWTGIGIGGDAAYMDRHPYPELAWQYIYSWTDIDTGQPFSNIVIEVMGTMGIAGLIPFLGILAYAARGLFQALRRRHAASPAAIALFVGFFSIFLALQFESTFLRYYLWSPLGLALGLLWQTRREKDASASETNEIRA